MNKSIACDCSAEDGDRKHVAQSMAEKDRRWEQNRKKYVIERLLSESSLNQDNDKGGNTKSEKRRGYHPSS